MLALPLVWVLKNIGGICTVNTWGSAAGSPTVLGVLASNEPEKVDLVLVHWALGGRKTLEISR